jgi:hypothetical protein
MRQAQVRWLVVLRCASPSPAPDLPVKPIAHFRLLTWRSALPAALHVSGSLCSFLSCFSDLEVGASA